MSRTPKVLAASFLLAAVASVGCTPPATAMSGGSPVPQSEADATLAAAFASVLLAPGVVPGATDALTRHQCGGALIAPDRIVTAAHCVVDPASLTLTAPATPLPPEQLTAAIGAHSLSDPSLHEIPVVSVSISPDFRLIPSTTDPDNLDRASASGDIAELTLAHPVDGVEPLARASAVPEPGTRARFYGHGWTPDNSKSDVLLSGELEIMSTFDCRTATGRTTAETPLLCAQDRTITDATPLDQARSVQAGYGDSGGPLVMFLNGTPTLLGVFSFGTETVGPLFTPGFNAFTPV